MRCLHYSCAPPRQSSGSYAPSAPAETLRPRSFRVRARRRARRPCPAAVSFSPHPVPQSLPCFTPPSSFFPSSSLQHGSSSSGIHGGCVLRLLPRLSWVPPSSSPSAAPPSAAFPASEFLLHCLASRVRLWLDLDSLFLFGYLLLGLLGELIFSPAMWVRLWLDLDSLFLFPDFRCAWISVARSAGWVDFLTCDVFVEMSAPMMCLYLA